MERAVVMPIGDSRLHGDLSVPTECEGIVLFAHGSGSSRKSSRNRFVAADLNQHGLATLLMDLLTIEEEEIDRVTRELRFDIDLLARRLEGAVDWIRAQPLLTGLPIGLFGASTGAAAALIASAERVDMVDAVVSRGGRPDLAGRSLSAVRAPTLLLVGAEDYGVIELNEQALQALSAPEKVMKLIPGATHLFEEPGTLETVAELAGKWFRAHLTGKKSRAPSDFPRTSSKGA